MMLAWMLWVCTRGVSARMVADPPMPQPAQYIVDEKASEYQIACVVKLPAIDDYDRSSLAALVSSIPSGTKDFNESEIEAITGGRLISCSAMPDHLDIEFSVEKPYLKPGLALLAAILRELPTDAPPLDATQEPQAGPPDAWMSLIRGPIQPSEPHKLKAGELTRFYHRIMRPESVSVAIDGPKSQDDPVAIWQNLIKDWQVDDDLGLPAPGVASESWPVSVTSIEIAGPDWSAESPGFSSQMLAVFALGCGKGGSLHRIVRDRDGISYRQEAILWPTQKGWRARLVVAADGLADPSAYLAKMRTELLADVALWDSSSRLRALGMAQGVLLHGIPVSPFYFRAERPVTTLAYDRAFLSAYWLMKTGKQWNPEALYAGLEGVSLEKLRRAAVDMIEQGKVIVREPAAAK